MDGGHPLDAFSAECERLSNDGVEEIVTSLYHDLDTNGVSISGTTEPGNIRKNLNYHLKLPALDRFVDGFENCKQVSGRAYTTNRSNTEFPHLLQTSIITPF